VVFSKSKVPIVSAYNAVIVFLLVIGYIVLSGKNRSREVKLSAASAPIAIHMTEGMLAHFSDTTLYLRFAAVLMLFVGR
jgi:hypothetical protein